MQNESAVDEGADRELAILRVLLGAGALMGIFSLVIDLSNRMPLHAVLFPAGSAIVLLVLLVLSFRSGTRSAATVAALGFFDFLYVPLGWLSAGGLEGAFPFMAILFLVLTLVVVRNGKVALVFLVLYSVLLIVLIVLEYAVPGLVVPFDSPEHRLAEVAPHFIFSVLGIAVLVWVVLGRYRASARRSYRMSITDELTGVYNRRHLRRRIREEIARSRREESSFVLICVHVAKFPDLRSRHGATLADLALVALGRLLLDNSRDYDVVGRYGGDEFLCLLPNADFRVAEGFIVRLDRAFSDYSEGFPDVSLSLVWGQSPGTTDDADALIAEAREDLRRRASGGDAGA